MNLMKPFFLSTAILALTLAACETGTAVGEVDAKPQAEAQVAFTNATAMQSYDNLGLVKGAPKPLPEAGGTLIANPQAVFADAISYAADTKSYSLLVWWKGNLVLETYFDPYDQNVRPEPASMHKSLLGLVTAKAIADGLIESADTPIGTYIDTWKDDPRGEITVRQLLTMSSGLAPLSYEGGEEAPARKFMAGTLDARATLLNMQLEEGAEPHFHYINTVSQLLMLTLEEAIGQPYVDYLSEQIWQPIGAEDAYVYYFEEDGFPRGYASFLATAKDWLRLGLLVKDNGAFGGGQVIDASVVKALKAPSELNPDYGWQIWRGETYEENRFYNDEKAGFSVYASAPYLADDLVYFDGFGGQRVITSETEDLLIVRLGDTRTDWDDAKLPNLVIGALHTLDAE